MERNEELWGLAHGHARSYLRRFEDPFTRSECDDLVQESAVAAWQWAREVREPQRFAAAVRTIARRKRFHALRARRRRLEEHAALPTREVEPEASCFEVAGRRVPRDWLLTRLLRGLERLRPLDRRILIALQEGFCCAEIAARLHLTEESVKVRIHRARRRVRKEIEDAVRTADELDGFSNEG